LAVPAEFMPAFADGDAFQRDLVAAEFAEVVQEGSRAEGASDEHALPSAQQTRTVEAFSATTARLLLEWGHAQHFFGRHAGAKTSFLLAKRASGLRTRLTGALGRRTKFQAFDVTQLVLRARSVGAQAHAALQEALHAEAVGGGEGRFTAASLRKQGLLESQPSHSAAPPPALEPASAPSSAGEATVIDGTDAMQRNVALGGIRQLTLDEVDSDNIRLEHIKFTELQPQLTANATTTSAGGSTAERGAATAAAGQPATQSVSADVVDGPVSVLDQCIILALCLDVKNHNPVDGLTTEEMRPYVARALDTPLDWTVHSTGLLLRCLVEFEGHRTADRAVLQLQALIDQQTLRLSTMQASRRSYLASSLVLRQFNILFYADFHKVD
jgi:hypothetical protein